jgi:hypothetical protein
MPATERQRRWFNLSPDRFVISLLLAVCLLWLSDRFQWFDFNHHKGWTVLITVAAVGGAALVMLLWWIAGLIFRWRFQFGIRSLLAFCLASSIAAGWLAVEIKRARRQAEAVERLLRSSHWVNYEWEVRANGFQRPNPTPPGPSWLRNLLGVDFFSDVANVGLNSDRPAEVTDVMLEQLMDLTRLRQVWLYGTKITDTEMKQLEGLTQLQLVELIGTTEVTETGLKKLQRALPNCQIIH